MPVALLPPGGPRALKRSTSPHGYVQTCASLKRPGSAVPVRAGTLPAFARLVGDLAGYGRASMSPRSARSRLTCSPVPEWVLPRDPEISCGTLAVTATKR